MAGPMMIIVPGSRSKKRVEYPSIMNFEGKSASGAKDICDFFDCIERKFVEDVRILTYAGSDFPFDSLQFTFTEVKSDLLDLDDDKSPGFDGLSPRW
jgi:hypothetical protein